MTSNSATATGPRPLTAADNYVGDAECCGRTLHAMNSSGVDEGRDERGAFDEIACHACLSVVGRRYYAR